MLWNKSKVEKLERYPEFPISHNRRKPLLQSKEVQEKLLEKKTIKCEAEKPIKQQIASFGADVRSSPVEASE